MKPPAEGERGLAERSNSGLPCHDPSAGDIELRQMRDALQMSDRDCPWVGLPASIRSHSGQPMTDCLTVPRDVMVSRNP